MGPTPERPSQSACQVVCVSLPTGVTRPMPVTTTRFVIVSSHPSSGAAPPRPWIRQQRRRDCPHATLQRYLQLPGRQPKPHIMLLQEVSIGLAPQERLVAEQPLMERDRRWHTLHHELAE